ncbi:MAG: hypothetical protein KatS3mg019_0257 [Fimbriimonadales bacterium]|nr:MAG: hypothetical protein KatS3mg019_0257 [Fimbriimonadales bacterium]
MTMYRQQSGVESEQRYSPEEAGEILKLAANLQDESFTVEQLRAIAREAGIDDSHLSNALGQYQQRQQQARLRQREQQRRRKRWFIGAGVVLVAAILFASSAISWVIPYQRSTGFAPTGNQSSPAVATLAGSPNTNLGDLLASSRSCAVYKVSTPDEKQQIVIVRDDGSEFILGHYFTEVTFASVSPTGKYIALFDRGLGEVWVVDVNGEGLHWVTRAGERRGEGTVISGINPIAGWRTYGGRDRLKARLTNGGTAYVFAEH